MGEYEPDDSRNVTLKPNNVPGEPTPTGVREDEARRQAQPGKAEPDKTQPHQQQQAQSQSGGGMSQSMGGMSQSIGEPRPNTVTGASKEEQPSAPGASRVQADTFEEKDVQVVDPAPWGAEATPPSKPDPNRESDTGIGGQSYDSYADTLSEQADSGDDALRHQAAEQGDAGDVPTRAEDDAEAAEEDSASRGYGDSGEERLSVLRDGNN